MMVYSFLVLITLVTGCLALGQNNPSLFGTENPEKWSILTSIIGILTAIYLHFIPIGLPEKIMAGGLFVSNIGSFVWFLKKEQDRKKEELEQAPY